MKSNSPVVSFGMKVCPDISFSAVIADEIVSLFGAHQSRLKLFQERGTNSSHLVKDAIVECCRYLGPLLDIMVDNYLLIRIIAPGCFDSGSALTCKIELLGGDLEADSEDVGTRGI